MPEYQEQNSVMCMHTQPPIILAEKCQMIESKYEKESEGHGHGYTQKQ